MNWKKAALAASAGAIEVIVIISGFLVVFFATFDPNSLLLFAPPTPPDFRDFLFVAGYGILVVLGGTLPALALGAGFIKSFAASLVAHMGLLALFTISLWAAFLILLIPPTVVTLVAIRDRSGMPNNRLQRLAVILGALAMVPFPIILINILPETLGFLDQFLGALAWVILPGIAGLLQSQSSSMRPR